MSATNKIDDLRRELERQRDLDIQRIEEEYREDLEHLNRIAARVARGGNGALIVRDAASKAKPGSGRRRRGPVKHAVLQAIRSMDCDYTAEMVYEEIKKANPAMAERAKVPSIGVVLRRFDVAGIAKRVRKGTYRTLSKKGVTP